VNSAFFGLRGDVRSIGQALALLGIENVRRWATLSVLASIDDKPTELTVTALIRARFCELAGAQLPPGNAAELFTLGLFSVIDGMMDAPMHDVVASLPLADDMREALVLRRGEKGRLLDCVASLEAGDDEHAHAIVARAGALYLEAVMWANAAAESLFGEPGVPLPASANGNGHHFAAPSVASVEPSDSQPPPGAVDMPVEVVPDTAGAAAPVARAGDGFFARIAAAIRRWFAPRGVD